MKVKLATQLLSSSVSNALTFMRTTVKKSEFLDSLGTEKFCMMKNDIFDLLNSRQAFTKVPTRSSINHNNIDEVRLKITVYKNYIKFLHYNDKPILDSRRKLGFYGLIITMRGCLAIFQKYGSCDDSPLQYLLTYKLSQDHLELFFSSIRARGGKNNNPIINNPTTEQFEVAFKWLLVYAQIGGLAYANCIKQDDTCILQIKKSVKKEISKEKDIKLTKTENQVSASNNLNSNYQNFENDASVDETANIMFNNSIIRSD